MPSHEKPMGSLAVAATDHVLGPPDARLTVIEYGDFECPSCEQAHGAITMIREKFGDKLRFVYRHYPQREVHPLAEMAAEASEAAGAQGRFWEMEDLLFRNQLHLRAPALRKYALSLELDMIRYDAEMADHVYLQRVQEHIESGNVNGVRNTPSFFLNGRFVDVSFGIQHLFEALERLDSKP